MYERINCLEFVVVKTVQIPCYLRARSFGFIPMQERELVTSKVGLRLTFIQNRDSYGKETKEQA